MALLLCASGCSGGVVTGVTSTDVQVIIVGSGAGGGPLASRLARSGVRVLLLEAGEDVGDKPQYQVPAMHALSTEDPALAWWYFVQHHTDAAIDRTDSKYTPAGILYPRGSALGGSTAVNALVSVVPPPSDWDRLATTTNDRGFRAAQMAPYLDRVNEWLAPTPPDASLALGDAQVVAMLSAAATTFAAEQSTTAVLGHDAGQLAGLFAQDMNERLASAETTGVFRLPLATHDGARTGTRGLLLDTVAAGFPLQIVTGALVTRVLWDEAAETPTAIGVEYLPQPAIYGASLQKADVAVQPVVVTATKEVVLSAGTFNTPQLLQLSGIGDATTLASLGIPVRADRPGVGQNLQDRDEASVVSELEQPVELVKDCALGADVDPCLDSWREGHGVYRTTGFLATVLRRSPGATQADLQIFGTPGDARGYYPGYAMAALAHKERFSWLLLKAHTQNRDGVVSLVDALPTSSPRIHFHSYDETDPLHDPDLRALVDGVKFVRKTLAAAGVGHPREIWPGTEQTTDDQLAAFIRKESWGHHACCTSRMGPSEDPGAVVDSRFRVIGTSRLRVVDASVFPEIPGTFLAMPLYLLSERAADVMLEDL